MRVYKCDICGKDVEFRHELEQFPAYNPATQTVEMRDHCPSCLKRALAILTVNAMKYYPLLDFDIDTTLYELIAEVKRSDDMMVEVFNHIADRETDFQVVFTRNPAQIPKEGEE